MTQVERRKSPRVSANLPLRLTVGGRTVETRIRDLSSSGIRFGTPEQLPLLSRVQIALELPTGSDGTGSHPIAIAGVVVRCEKMKGQDATPTPWDTAIFFESLPEGARSLLATFVTGRNR